MLLLRVFPASALVRRHEEREIYIVICVVSILARRYLVHTCLSSKLVGRPLVPRTALVQVRNSSTQGILFLPARCFLSRCACLCCCLAPPFSKDNFMKGQAAVNTTRDYIRAALFFANSAILLTTFAVGYAGESERGMEFFFLLLQSRSPAIVRHPHTPTTPLRS